MKAKSYLFPVIVIALSVMLFSSHPALAERVIPYRVKSSAYFKKKSAYWYNTEPNFAEKLVTGIKDGVKGIVSLIGTGLEKLAQ